MTARQAILDAVVNRPMPGRFRPQRRIDAGRGQGSGLTPPSLSDASPPRVLAVPGGGARADRVGNGWDDVVDNDDDDLVTGDDGRGGVPARPGLTPSLTAEEFHRWYYLKSELMVFARRLGASVSGSKEELTMRISLILDGEPEVRVAHGRRVPVARQLQPPVSAVSVIPAGQRCSQVLREFFVAEVGRSFRFDTAMRDFIANGEGRTLGDAAEHWRATRGSEPASIGPQFELNRFTRQWSADHPGGSREELLAAWRRYRSAPEDARGRA